MLPGKAAILQAPKDTTTDPTHHDTDDDEEEEDGEDDDKHHSNRRGRDDAGRGRCRLPDVKLEKAWVAYFAEAGSSMPPSCPPAPPPLARIVPGTGGGVGSMIVPIEGACRREGGGLTVQYTDAEGEVVSVPVSGPMLAPAEGSVLTCGAAASGKKGEGGRQLVTSVGAGGGKKMEFEKGVGRGPAAPSVLMIMVDSMSREQAVRYVIDPINDIFPVAQRTLVSSAAASLRFRFTY